MILNNSYDCFKNMVQSVLRRDLFYPLICCFGFVGIYFYSSENKSRWKAAVNLLPGLKQTFCRTNHKFRRSTFKSLVKKTKTKENICGVF